MASTTCRGNLDDTSSGGRSSMCERGSFEGVLRFGFSSILVSDSGAITSWTSQVNQTLLTLVLSSSGRTNISSFLRLEPRHRPLAWDDSGALKKKLMSYWSLIQFLYDFCNKIDKHPINNCKRENIYIYIFFFAKQNNLSFTLFMFPGSQLRYICRILNLDGCLNETY
jgi:hypothetical protein